MYNSFKIYILMAMFIPKLGASELTSLDRPFWQLYDLTAIPAKVITWIGEQSGYTKPKSVIQRMAIRTVTENKNKQQKFDSQLKRIETQTSKPAKSLIDTLVIILQDLEWTWNTSSLEESDEESLKEGFQASSQDILIFPQTSIKKPAANSTLRNTTKKEPEVTDHAFLYKNKRNKGRKSKALESPSQDTILSATQTKKHIDGHTRKALNTSQSLEQCFYSTPIQTVQIIAKQDPLDAIITDNLCHPLAGKIASSGIKNADGSQCFHEQNDAPSTDTFVLSIHSIEKLEAELSPFFAEIANTRSRYTTTCEELIEKVDCLLTCIDISLRDELFHEKIKSFERQKIDLETKKYDFEQYVQKILVLQKHANQENSSNYFYVAIENIYLYNVYLLEKIKNFENILYLMNNYL